MRPGTMDFRVQISRYAEIGRDELNAPIFDWSVITDFWASRKDMSADERFGASQVYASTTTVFRAWWFEDLKPTDRLTCDGVVYDIKGIKILGRREGLEITAEAQQ